MHGTEVKVQLVIMLQAGFEPATEFLEGKLELHDPLGLMEMNLRAGGVVADEIVCCFHHDHETVDDPDEL